MLNRPVSVRIGATDVEVVWENRDWQHGNNCFGRWDPVAKTIRVFDSGKPALLAACFVHEVAHAMLWYFENMKREDNMTEEGVANTCGYYLSDFWRSNPQALDWYVDCIKSK